MHIKVCCYAMADRPVHYGEGDKSAAVIFSMCPSCLHCDAWCRVCLGQSCAGHVSWAPRSGGHVLSLSHTVHL